MSETELISKLNAGRAATNAMQQQQQQQAAQANNIDHSQEMDIDILQVQKARNLLFGLAPLPDTNFSFRYRIPPQAMAIHCWCTPTTVKQTISSMLPQTIQQPQTSWVQNN